MPGKVTLVELKRYQRVSVDPESVLDVRVWQEMPIYNPSEVREDTDEFDNIDSLSASSCLHGVKCLSNDQIYLSIEES